MAKEVFSSFGRKGSDNCLAPSIVASHCAKIEVLKLAFIFHRWIQQFRILVDKISYGALLHQLLAEEGLST